MIVSPPHLFKKDNYHTPRLMSTNCQQAVQPGSPDLLLSRLIETTHITSEALKPCVTDHNSGVTITVPSTNQDQRSIVKYSYQTRGEPESRPTPSHHPGLMMHHPPCAAAIAINARHHQSLILKL